jgi:hypothetical protein
MSTPAKPPVTREQKLEFMQEYTNLCNAFEMYVGGRPCCCGHDAIISFTDVDSIDDEDNFKNHLTELSKSLN